MILSMYILILLQEYNTVFYQLVKKSGTVHEEKNGMNSFTFLWNYLFQSFPFLSFPSFPFIDSRYFVRYSFSGSTYLSKPSVVIDQSKSSPLIVFLFSRWHLSLASLVMNEINSDTHSWTVSFASFALGDYPTRWLSKPYYCLTNAFVLMSSWVPEMGVKV